MNKIQRWILGKELANRIEQLKSARFEVRNGRIIVPSDNKTTYIKDGYSVNDIVYSIINIILDKVRLPEWGLFKVVDEQKLRQYHTTFKNKDISPKQYKQALRLKEQSLEPITNLNFQAGKLAELFKYPNEAETINDYIANSCGFKLLTGDIYDWAESIPGGANEGVPNSLWQLPPQYIKILVSDTFPLQEMSYELLTWNYKFKKTEVLHERYFNPNWDVMGYHLYGMSPS